MSALSFGAWMPCSQARPCRPSFSRQRATLRPYIKQDSDANGVAFGIKRCGRNDAFGLKMRFIVKFSRKNLSEWFSYRTFAPQEARRWQRQDKPADRRPHERARCVRSHAVSVKCGKTSREMPYST